MEWKKCDSEVRVETRDDIRAVREAAYGQLFYSVRTHRRWRWRI